MGKIIPARLIVASLLCLQPYELINFRELEDGGAVAIAPTGQKYKFTAEHLAAKEQILATTLETENRTCPEGIVPNPIVGVGLKLTQILDTEARAISGDPVSIDPLKENLSVLSALAVKPSPLETEKPRVPEGIDPNSILDKIMETKERQATASPVTTHVDTEGRSSKTNPVTTKNPKENLSDLSVLAVKPSLLETKKSRRSAEHVSKKKPIQ
jgi:hypothetical protein